MEKLLTSHDVALAIGASESSLRRWTNSGAIRTSRTVGGHRRIPLSEAIRFIRESGATIVRPELLGLPVEIAGAPRTTAEADAGDDTLYRALVDGDARSVTAVVLGAYVGGSPLADFFDGALARAMHRVGDLWRHDARGIFIEHRATDICLQAVAQLRPLQPPPAPAAPAAIGGAPAGDPYMLPSLLAATVLADAGYRVTNLGPQSPIEVLSDAAAEQEAPLVWLSVSTVLPEKETRRALERLAARLKKSNAALLLGGRHAASVAPRPAANVHVLQSMSALAAYARGAKPLAPQSSERTSVTHKAATPKPVKREPSPASPG